MGAGLSNLKFKQSMKRKKSLKTKFIMAQRHQLQPSSSSAITNEMLCKPIKWLLICKLTLYMRVCSTASFISDQYNPNLIVNTTTNHPSNMNNNGGSTLSHTYQRICGVSHILSTVFGFLTFLWFLSHSDTIHYIFWTLNMNWYYNFIS